MISRTRLTLASTVAALTLSTALLSAPPAQAQPYSDWREVIRVDGVKKAMGDFVDAYNQICVQVFNGSAKAVALVELTGSSGLIARAYDRGGDDEDTCTSHANIYENRGAVRFRVAFYPSKGPMREKSYGLLEL